MSGGETLKQSESDYLTSSKESANWCEGWETWREPTQWREEERSGIIANH